MRKAVRPERRVKPAASLADPARAAMLAALMDGIALPAGELAAAAGVNVAAAGIEIARLVDAGLLAIERQGRHCYYRLPNADIAAALETMADLMPRSRTPRRHGDPSLWRARLCYHHLAGRLGVAMRTALVDRRWLRVDADTCALTRPGRGAVERLGLLESAVPVDLPGRPCLDWTERRHHIGGPLGRELTRGLIERVGWLRHGAQRRALVPTATGRAALPRELGIDPAVLIPDGK